MSATRTERFDLEPGGAAVEVDLVVGAGAVRVELSEDAAEVVVHLSAAAGPPAWQQRIGGVLAALGQVGAGTGSGPDGDAPDASDEAQSATEVVFAAGRRRLVVRSPQSGPLRSVPVEVTVLAPAGGGVRVRASSADVVLTGTAGTVDVGTGSGRVSATAVAGRADVRTGSGEVRVDAPGGRTRVRTGSGAVVLGAVTARTEVVTGTGDVRVGVGAGTTAELDVRTGSGTARSELTVLDEAPPQVAAVGLRVRTGSGDVVVHGA